MKSELAILKVEFPLYPGSLGKIVKVISKPNPHYWMIDMDGNIGDCASEYLQIIGTLCVDNNLRMAGADREIGE